MKERPILFSGPMIRALLEGRKAQTRRVLKPQPTFTAAQELEIVSAFPGTRLSECVTQAWLDGWVDVKCPYGQPGDRLWVRETFAPHADEEECYRNYMKAAMGSTKPEIFYAADGGEPHVNNWRPSIHMPRWASRLTLEVTEVRVQRLQDISEEDARAEGAPSWPGAAALAGTYGTNHRANFIDLWDFINGERPGCSWESNPWVWAISFRVLP